jgi:uncharacterized radical SAM superfamily Fe-S cluster-containing enzyme
LHETRSLCPTCGERIPARYEAIADGAAIFSRTCPQHGVHETDLGPHAAFYRHIFAVDRTLKERFGHLWMDKDYASPSSPFPMRQRAGLGIVEVTERCNLTCPMCYASSSPAGRDYTVEEIGRRMDELLAVEGQGMSLQLSGGEPSVRKDLDVLARMAKEKGFAHLEMVSNGIRLAKEPDFAERMAEWGFTSVYLQFDSRRAEDIVKLRGDDLLDIRERAIEHLTRAGIPCTLAVPLYAGINDDQIGPAVDFAWRHTIVCAIAFQAATPFGRWSVDGHSSEHTPKKLRMPEILHLIEQQVGVPYTHFFPLGIGSPLCNAYTLLIHTPNGYVPIAPKFSLEDYLDLVGPDPLETIRLLTQGRPAVIPKITRNLKGTLKLVKTLWPHIGADPSFLLKHKTLTLYVKPFMDASDVDVERMERCCFHNASPKGVMSFCALNNYARQQRPTPESAFVQIKPRRERVQA